MQMTRTDLDARERELVAVKVRRRRTNPLRYAELWHQGPPRTTQRALTTLAHNPLLDAVLCAGGNGSGKTELGAMVSVAVALGRKHPDARAWADRNGFPLSRLPDRPGRVIASALTSNDSRRVQRSKVRGYLPAGSQWRNEDGNGEAEVIVPGGGAIVFKSNDQGRRAYQGDWADFIWPDEEHDRDVFNECLMRVARVPGGMGWVLLTMTPLKGRTWVYDEFVRVKKPDRGAFWIWAEDNPYLPAEKMERVLSSYGEHEQAARRRGDFTVLEGLVYSMWSQHLHVVEHFDPPPEWPRFRAWDPGTRNPTSVGWYALDTKDDVLHKYGEWYRSGLTLGQHCDIVKARDPGPFVWTVVDSAAAGDRLSMAVEHGIENIPAHKDIRRGLNAVAERLRPDAEGRPHLLIHDNCPEQIREIEGYIWAQRGGAADMPDLPLKANDHACDELRYQCVALSRSEYAGHEPAADEEAA